MIRTLTRVTRASGSIASVASVTAVALLGLLVACSDSPAGTNAVTPLLDSGGASGAAAPDAASIEPRPELCQGLTHQGEVVPEFHLPGDPPPPLGGTPVLGTYDLIELDAYGGVSDPDAGNGDGGDDGSSTIPTGKAAQITVVVTEFSISTDEVRGTTEPNGLGPEKAHAELYRVDGTSLVLTAVCPATALPVPMSFSEVSGSLVLFRDATHRELYRRRP